MYLFEIASVLLLKRYLKQEICTQDLNLIYNFLYMNIFYFVIQTSSLIKYNY